MILGRVVEAAKDQACAGPVSTFTGLLSPPADTGKAQADPVSVFCGEGSHEYLQRLQRGPGLCCSPVDRKGPGPRGVAETRMKAE